MSPALTALAVLLAFGAAWELLGAAEERTRSTFRRLPLRVPSPRQTDAPEVGPAGPLGDLIEQLGLSGRIERAGLDGRLGLGALLLGKLVGALAGALVCYLVLPMLPGRLVLPAAVLLVAAGFLAPDAWIERLARRRAARALAALPDALDILAVGIAAGRDPTSVFAEIASVSEGPLADELARVAAEIEFGTPPRDAYLSLRRGVGTPAIGSLIAALERSRELGSPLAEQLHGLAVALRRDARRRIEERAARAAPKIQLVVALLLVPSVLLIILAAAVAHSDSLIGAF